MGEGIGNINQKVAAFKRKYYLNLFLRGSILTLSLILGYFLLASVLEYNLWLGRGARFVIFASFFLLVVFCLFQFLRKPLRFWIYKRGLGQEESAKLIGHYFPTVGDRLLNVIQLASTENPSMLLDAGITQKSSSFKDIAFDTAVDFKQNTKYLKYFAAPLLIIVLLLFIDRGIFTQSTQRIVQFNQEFSPKAPFDFVVKNKILTAFFNEDFSLQLSLDGKALPESAYIITGQQRWKMENVSLGKFAYTFEKIQNEIELQFEASGFYSGSYKIQLINRPEITKINVLLTYPGYLRKKSEELSNGGNLEVPEGTKVTWKIGAANTVKAQISFTSDQHPNDMQIVDDQLFNFTKNIKDPDQYSIVLENEKSKNKDQISYSIGVIKDQHPQIVVDNLRDSILFKSILLGGSVSDDYGITELKLNYQISKGAKESPQKSIQLTLQSAGSQQNFFYQWNVDSLKLAPGDKLTYDLQVWDNDGVNGRKSSRSANYIFSLPSEEELKTNISKSQQSTESKIDQSLRKAKDLKESIDEAQQKLRGKQNLDWQDKKMLEDLIQQKQKLDQAINDLQKENQLLEQKKESFSQESERIKEKSEQIQKLMNELLDEETKKLFEELEKLLKENSDPSQMQKILDKMDRKEINMEKELERTLALFKQLQYDYKLEQAIDALKEEREKQEKLLEKTDELTGDKKNEQKDSKDNKDSKDTDSKNNKDSKDNKDSKSEEEKPTPEKLAEEQEELKKDSEKFEESMKDLKKMGEELDKSEETPSDQKMQELKDSQQKSKESLEQGNPKKSAEQQKKSISQMKQMQEQLEGMQNSMEMEMDMANLESLRQIIHGLIKLSYDQENLMKDFAQVQQTDPKYIQLSQNQLKIKDDSKVLEDSLLAVAKKDPFMGSVVTKEIGELNDHLDKAATNIKERRKGNASTEMQFSMTSINNLALMLNDHFDMMMNMMANAMPSPGKGKKGKQPNLGKLQQQLNQQMEQLKNGGKSGRQLSEEFAKMAAEQERIRRALQEMQEKMKKEGGKIPGGDLPGKMEQTEMDLVNKQITEQTIRRQNEIITRLLEAEKSMREQNQDEERKGESAKEYNKEIPRNFEEYLRLKEKEVELLKTVPPKLFPYYKKEVNEYFKRIGTKD